MDIVSKTIFEIIDMNGLYVNENIIKKISNESVNFILNIIDSSKLYMNLGNRDRLMRSDIQNTLNVFGIEELYGYTSKTIEMKNVNFSCNEILKIYPKDYIEVENEIQSVPEYELENSYTFKWIAFNNKLLLNENNTDDMENNGSKRSFRKNDLINCLIRDFVPASFNIIKNGSELFNLCLTRIENEHSLQKFFKQYLDFIQNQLTYYQNDHELMYRIAKLITTFLNNKNLIFTKHIDELVSYILTLLLIPAPQSGPYNIETRDEACVSLGLICDLFNDIRSQIADELYDVITHNSCGEMGVYSAIKAFRFLGMQILELKFIPRVESLLSLLKKRKYKQDELIMSTLTKILEFYYENGLAQSKNELYQNTFFQKNHAKISKIINQDLMQYSHKN